MCNTSPSPTPFLFCTHSTCLLPHTAVPIPQPSPFPACDYFCLHFHCPVLSPRAPLVLKSGCTGSGSGLQSFLLPHSTAGKQQETAQVNIFRHEFPAATNLNNGPLQLVPFYLVSILPAGNICPLFRLSESPPHPSIPL